MSCCEDYFSFYDRIYGLINVRDKDVIDVGAFIGDTAIYFVNKGARRVVAVEPHPRAFEELLRNMINLGLSSRVIPINAALASTSGFIDVPLDLDLGAIMAMYFGPMMRSTYSNSNVKIRLITLKELINETNVDTDVLKMNCEGCEYDVILNDYDHLRLFREVVFEYHRWMTGISVSELLKILGRDYNCNFIGIPYEDYGYVHCVRKDIV